MQCPNEKYIDDFLIGELAGSELRAFQKHLDGCAACQAQIVEERAFESTLHAAEFRRAPADLRAKVMQQVHPTPTRNNIPDWLTALGFGLFLAFLGSLVGKWKLPDMETGFSRLTSSPLVTDISNWISNLFSTSTDGLFEPLSGGSSILILNLLAAGIILFWGLWQMVRAMR